MKRSIRRDLTLLVLLALGSMGCAGSPRAVVCVADAWVRETAPAAAADDETPSAVNDRELHQRLLGAAIKMIDAQGVTDGATLKKQLERQRCALALPGVAAQPAPGADAVTLYDRARRGVLVMAGVYKCPKCTNWHINTASGFVLSGDGVAVTNYHVVNDDFKLIAAMTADGRVVPVTEVLAADRSHDVAIIRLGGGGFAPLPLLAEAPIGSRVYVISHPAQEFYTFTAGMVSRHVRKADGSPRLAITADFARGSSGGPVLNDRGQVVGMVAETETIYFNRPNSEIKDPQMVVKLCVPVSSVLALIDRDAKADGDAR